MYSILIVDDEPLICKGLGNLLSTSGLRLDSVYLAHSAYEALDYIRMENIDLLVTDIQMGAMNGIELMHQAKMIKPWLETIVISAHETFQYAQMAIRLGARDYMVKPLNNAQFLDTVRNVLLHSKRPAADEESELSGTSVSFRMAPPDVRRGELLNALLAGKTIAEEAAAAEASKLGMALAGPYFAAVVIRLPGSGGSEGQRGDERLLRYAALNIVSELLDKQWRYEAFYSPDETLGVLFQWSEAEYAGTIVNPMEQLEMIGKGLHYNLGKFLRLSCVVGISQILRGAEFLPQLGAQARKAAGWNREHKDHFVFSYGDYKWGLHADDPSEDEWIAQSNLIVEKAKSYIDGHYARKGITLNEVARTNHVSPNYLSYLFKKYMGCNLWEYVIRLRMEESRQLILTTDMRRYEIADKVGYESPEHFSKIFKKYYGISPSEMKK